MTDQLSEGDPDHDGISNFDEFLDGTNPTSKASLRPRLIVYRDSGGSVTVSPMKLNYELGESVTLTAMPIAPSVFLGWDEGLSTGGVVNTTNPLTFSIDGNKTVRARFASAVKPPPGLVACWRAENDANDVTGANNGTPGVRISFGEGKVGQAFSFNSDTIKVSASRSLDVGVGNGFTLEAWIKPADAVNRYPVFEWNDGSPGTSPPPWGVHLWISERTEGGGGPGSILVNIVDTTRAPHILSSPTELIKGMVWQHVAVTYDRLSGMCRLFLNSVQVASANLGTFVPLTTFDLYLGHRPFSAGDVFYSGMMDELTIYNQALTLNEIFDVYNADFVGRDFASPYFTSPSLLPDAVFGASFSHQLSTTLGTAPISFSVSSGALPLGIALSSAGVVSGIPGAGGTFDFIVLAKDGAGKSTKQLCVLRVLQPVTLPADLVAWWRGEPASTGIVVVSDIIGNHDGGFFIGNTAANPVYTPDGKVGSAFSFDGTLYVRVPDAAELRPDEMTAEAWIFPVLLSSVHPTIIARGSSINQKVAWWMGLLNGKPRFYSSHVGSRDLMWVEAPSAIPLNEWSHLAISFDGTVKRLYVNGVQVAIQERMGALDYDRTPVPITIGSDWTTNNSSERFIGRIDEVALYRRALSSDEVFALADAGGAGKNTVSPYINSPSRLPFGLVGHAYTHTFTAVLGTAPVGYALSAGSSNLPPGLVLTSAGVLSGVPVNTGRFTFKVRATDAAGLFAEQLCTLQVFSSVSVPAGLVGWWTAEGNAQDSSASINHGALRNGAGFAAGKVGQAFSLDGNDDFIEIPDAPALRPVSLTLEAWTMFDSTSGIRIVLSKPVGTGTRTTISYGIWLNNDELRGAVGDASGIVPAITSSFRPTPGKWYHLAYTFDDSTKQQALYVDGVQVALGAAPKSVGYDTQPLLIGRDTDEGVPRDFLQGRIDEAAIYNRALNPTEIASIYNAGPAGKHL